MTFFVEVRPWDVDGEPWQEGCDACESLKSDLVPATEGWLSVVRSHMEQYHDIWVMHTTDGGGAGG